MWVPLVASIIIGAVGDDHEQIKDQEKSTDPVTASPNIVRWIFIPVLIAVAVVIGCAFIACAFQKGRAALVPAADKTSHQHAVLPVESESAQSPHEQALPSDGSDSVAHVSSEQDCRALREGNDDKV